MLGSCTGLRKPIITPTPLESESKSTKHNFPESESESKSRKHNFSESESGLVKKLVGVKIRPIPDSFFHFHKPINLFLVLIKINKKRTILYT